MSGRLRSHQKKVRCSHRRLSVISTVPTVTTSFPCIFGGDLIVVCLSLIVLSPPALLSFLGVMVIVVVPDTEPAGIVDYSTYSPHRIAVSPSPPMTKGKTTSSPNTFPIQSVQRGGQHNIGRTASSITVGTAVSEIFAFCATAIPLHPNTKLAASNQGTRASDAAITLVALLNSPRRTSLV